MNLEINITTPAGKSLEGYPKQFISNSHPTTGEVYISGVLEDSVPINNDHALNKGDTITIKVL